MGYGSYSTPLGEAGYLVEDTCHEDGCEEAIDRGLGYLCGGQPGVAADGGCGRWFCAEHLFGWPDEAERGVGEGLCGRCAAAYEAEE